MYLHQKRQGCRTRSRSPGLRIRLLRTVRMYSSPPGSRHSQHPSPASNEPPARHDRFRSPAHSGRSAEGHSGRQRDPPRHERRLIHDRRRDEARFRIPRRVGLRGRSRVPGFRYPRVSDEKYGGHDVIGGIDSGASTNPAGADGPAEDADTGATPPLSS